MEAKKFYSGTLLKTQIIAQRQISPSFLKITYGSEEDLITENVDVIFLSSN